MSGWEVIKDWNKTNTQERTCILSNRDDTYHGGLHVILLNYIILLLPSNLGHCHSEFCAYHRPIICMVLSCIYILTNTENIWLAPVRTLHLAMLHVFFDLIYKILDIYS